MIILRTPKGWTGPKVVDGKPVEDTWRAHQVPVTNFVSHPDHVKILEEWLKGYSPEELFDGNGKLIPELAELAPSGERRMGANPHANGGLLLKDLVMPDFREYAVRVTKPGTETAEATRVLGNLLRDVGGGTNLPGKQRIAPQPRQSQPQGHYPRNRKVRGVSQGEVRAHTRIPLVQAR